LQLSKSADFRAAMQHILSVAAKNSFAPQRDTSSSLPADAADRKIETFEIVSLDVQRERVMLLGTTTEYLSGFFCTSRFHAHE
jgi:hypothetical protein